MLMMTRKSNGNTMWNWTAYIVRDNIIGILHTRTLSAVIQSWQDNLLIIHFKCYPGHKLITERIVINNEYENRRNRPCSRQ